jgi:leader peptidase (prepilin peptidase) / N-methyltransferase
MNPAFISGALHESASMSLAFMATASVTPALMNMSLAIALAFLGGLLIGSFLNVCVFRLPRDLSVVSPSRSFCPECEQTIAWYDNIPLVSFAILKGQCRQCGAPIPLRYPMVELATAVAFAVCVGTLGLTLLAFKFAVFSAILITLIASDAEERILPDEFTLGGVIAALILSYFVLMPPVFTFLFIPAAWGRHWQSVAESALGGGIASGSIWFVGYLYEKLRHREGLGLGDVKMIAMIGAFLGLQYALMTLIFASLAGAILGLIYIKVTKKEASTYELPFGSFIGAAALVVAVIERHSAR